MISQHYDEAALVALLDSPGAESDIHLVECADCRRSFEEYQAVTSCLGEQAVWDLRVLKEDPVPQTIQNIRAFADRMRDEDAAALPLVAELLAGPREQWMPRLQSDPKYRTAGVVRKLMEASDKAIDVMPPDALEISALATEIADHLDPTTYPSDTVMKLRGNAWRDRGFCLSYSGLPHEATRAIGNASAILASVPIADYEVARLGIVAALNHRALDSFDDALAVSRANLRTFSRFADLDRFAAASMAQAHTLVKVGRAREALQSLLRVLSFADALSDDYRARLFSNIAYCYRESGEPHNAARYFDIAVRSLSDGQSETEGLRLAWNVAILLANEGFESEAERRLLGLVTEFEHRNMSSEAILVRLDLVETYLRLERYDEVVMICRDALAFFDRVGVADTTRARTALGYLHEAAAQRILTRKAVKSVRAYFRALPVQPNLIFAPPPV